MNDREIWPLMVLAHNEERDILKCLEGLKTAEPENYHKLRVFVMANGCTDRTEEIVSNYAAGHSEVKLVSIAMPDKNNAWNVFVHETIDEYCPNSDVYFFMDGDATVGPGSLTAMVRALESHAEAHAVSAIPLTGRQKDRDAAEMLQRSGLVANLYGLRGDFARRLITQSVRLPNGLEGDDGLLGALIKWDLDPSNQFDHSRIVACPDAGFGFESMSWLRPGDWHAYWRRLVRYARRQYEFDLLRPRLKQQGLSGLPRHISEVYVDADKCKIKWGGLKPLTCYLALREMKKATATLNTAGTAGG